MPPITPSDFKGFREKCGFSKPMMAAHMRIPNPEANGRNAINRIEGGNHALGIPGPIATAAEALADGWRGICGTCERRAEDPVVRSCTHVDCPFPKESDDQAEAA